MDTLGDRVQLAEQSGVSESNLVKPLTNAVAPAFGELLKQLRKRMGMTQHDLAAALGYSRALIGALERNERLPDIDAVIHSYLPALGLQDEPLLATQLIELAALARGERPPPLLTFKRERLTASTSGEQEAMHRLPAQPTELLGRAAEVNELCTRLLGHSGRLLTLTGPPGIGKTTLALAMAARLRLHYRDGVMFVSLTAVNDPMLMVATIAAAVGCNDMNRLIEFLRRKTMLLVLDNLEQINEAAPHIAEFLTDCPGLCILATSRERLHLRAEQRYRVPPLDLAPAVELFVQRAQAVDSDFALTAHNQLTLAAICQRLDCLPLALELCAAQIDLLSPIQLLAQLQDHPLDLLVDGARDLPHHQRTLRTAIGGSYALLSAAERGLFRTLGVFVGGFDMPALVALGIGRPESEEWRLNDGPNRQSLLSTLHALIGKSLVHAETTPAGDQRFLLLETIREFALEQLQAYGEEALLRQRHCAAYLHLFRTGDSHLRGPEAVTWFARLGLEQDNLRAALRWSLDEARYTDAAWLVIVASGYWMSCGLGMEATGWLMHLLPHRHTLAADLRLAVLLWAYAFASGRAAFQSYERYTDEVMELLESCPNELLRAAAWHWIATTTPDAAKANVASERGVVLARAARDLPVPDAVWGLLGDRDFLLAENIRNYAERLIDQGNFEQAAALLAESLALYQTRGNRVGIGDALGSLGRIALLRVDLDEAQQKLQQAMTVSSGVGDLQGFSEWRYLLGRVSLYRDDTSEARRLLAESLNLCIDQQEDVRAARVCTCLAETALWEGKLDEAEHWLSQSLVYHSELQRITIYTVERLWVAARLATAQQQYPRAATLFSLADQVHGQVHYAIGGPMRAVADAALSTVRAALAPDRFVAAWAAGRALSVQEAINFVLAAASVSTRTETPTTPGPLPPSPGAVPGGLSTREVEVLRLLAAGMTYDQIAAQLIISPRTVNRHLTTIYTKLNVTSRHAATRFAQDHYLI